MAAVRHLGFLKVQNFNCHPVRRVNMHHRAKFRVDWSNRCWDMAVCPFFKMAAVHHLAFLGEKYEIFSAEVVGSASMHQCSKFHANWQSCCRDMTIFRFFQMAAVRYLGFLTVWNFNCRHDSEGQCTSPCKMGCWSVKPLQSYGRFFKMASDAVQRSNVHHRARYRADRSIIVMEIWLFSI